MIGLQADGSAMYTVQALWTQARENLDITTIVLSNRGYQILKGEMRNVGFGAPGPNARDLLEIEPARPSTGSPSPPAWVSRRHGAEDAEAFADLLAGSFKRKGPFLIEAVI